MSVSTNENVRFGRKFGSGDVHGDGNHNLSDMSPRKRLFAAAWAHACPVVLEVEEKYGQMWAFNRYTECNWIFEHEVLTRVEKLNPELFSALTSPVSRVKGEKHSPNIDPTFVPPSFETEMSPLSTPWGYAIPRMILAAKMDSTAPISDKKLRVAEIKQVIDESITQSGDPIELSLRLAEGLIGIGAEPEKLIYHLMGQGILEEEGCKSIYREIVGNMSSLSPKLHEAYMSMAKDTEALREKGIIVPSDLE